jgi:hypothetical protein
MEFYECSAAREITDACNNFYEQLKALGDEKAISDTSSMFNSIKGAAFAYDSKVGRATRGRIWLATNEHGQVVGLMRLKYEGDHFHLENLVGIPRAGGGAALLNLAKAISLSLEKELRLEAADHQLIAYYTQQCFHPTAGGRGMVWTQDT